MRAACTFRRSGAASGPRTEAEHAVYRCGDQRSERRIAGFPGIVVPCGEWPRRASPSRVLWRESCGDGKLPASRAIVKTRCLVLTCTAGRAHPTTRRETDAPSIPAGESARRGRALQLLLHRAEPGTAAQSERRVRVGGAARARGG